MYLIYSFNSYNTLLNSAMRGLLIASFRVTEPADCLELSFKTQFKAWQLKFTNSKELTHDHHEYRLAFDSKDDLQLLQKNIVQMADKNGIEVSLKVMENDGLASCQQTNLTAQQINSVPQQISNSSQEVIDIEPISPLQGEYVDQGESVSSNQFQLLEQEFQCPNQPQRREEITNYKKETKNSTNSVNQNLQIFKMKLPNQKIIGIPKSQVLISICQDQTLQIAQNQDQSNSAQCHVQHKGLTGAVQDSANLVDQRQESGQFGMINQNLMKYFSGKDDYTQVFDLDKQLGSEENQTQNIESQNQQKIKQLNQQADLQFQPKQNLKQIKETFDNSPPQNSQSDIRSQDLLIPDQTILPALSKDIIDFIIDSIIDSNIYDSAEDCQNINSIPTSSHEIDSGNKESPVQIEAQCVKNEQALFKTQCVLKTDNIKVPPAVEAKVQKTIEIFADNQKSEHGTIYQEKIKQPAVAFQKRPQFIISALIVTMFMFLIFYI